MQCVHVDVADLPKFTVSGKERGVQYAACGCKNLCNDDDNG